MTKMDKKEEIWVATANGTLVDDKMNKWLASANRLPRGLSDLSVWVSFKKNWCGHVYYVSYIQNIWKDYNGYALNREKH